MVGNGREGLGKDRRNGVGPGRNVQGSGAVGTLVRHRELGGDGEGAQGPVGVTPPGGATNDRDDGENWGRWRVGVTISSGGNGSRGNPPHWDVH